MIEKTTVLVIYIHKRVKSIFFAVPIEFCDELDLAILTEKYKMLIFHNKNVQSISVTIESALSLSQHNNDLTFEVVDLVRPSLDLRLPRLYA